MLSRLLILILMSFWLAACGGGGGGGGDTDTPGGGLPTAPSAPNLDAGSDTGVSSIDNITADNTPTFTGVGGVAGNTVTIYANGSPVGSAIIAGNGSWSCFTALSEQIGDRALQGNLSFNEIGFLRQQYQKC